MSDTTEERIKALAKAIADRYAARHGVVIDALLHKMLIEEITKALREVHQLGYEKGFNAGRDEPGF